MKKFLVLLCALTVAFGIGAANATMFVVDGDSYVNVDNDWNVGGSLSAELSGELDGLMFELAYNQSITFDFFTFQVDDRWNDGFGAGGFNVDAMLSIETPAFDIINAGSGIWGSGFGYSAGAFFWNNPVQNYILADGNEVSVALSQGFTLVPGSRETITATITNLGGAPAPVPEPSTVLLLGVGLVSLVGVGRKRFAKQS